MISSTPYGSMQHPSLPRRVPVLHCSAATDAHKTGDATQQQAYFTRYDACSSPSILTASIVPSFSIRVAESTAFTVLLSKDLQRVCYILSIEATACI